MDTTEFSGIHVDTSPTFQRDHLDPAAEDLANALPRKRNNVSTARSSDETDLDKLRKLVEEVEKERRDSGVTGCQRGSIEPSLMSAVFGVVLLIIITITVFAFASLYNALVKRFAQDQN